MGQKDPLTEWQREGFEMFGSMMKGIAQDFVRYVMHVQVVRQEAPAPQVQNVQQTSSESTAASTGFAAAASAGPVDGDDSTPAPTPAPAATKQRTVVNDAWAKTPRNAPCPCGSGKKFKLCHGAANA
jgi:preprotein translocase subunit SecA